MKNLPLIILLLFAFASQQTVSQTHIDRDLPARMSLEDLRELIINLDGDPSAIPYAKLYLKKAKKKRDSLKIARGYENLARLHDPATNIKYADSIVRYTKNSRHPNYPNVGYALKGFWSLQIDSYRDAWIYYNKAYQDAKSKGNKDYALSYLGVIMLFKMQYSSDSPPMHFVHKYFKDVQSVADSLGIIELNYYAYMNYSLAYRHKKNMDSASFWIDKGIEFFEEKKCKNILSKFHESKAEMAFFNGNYLTAEEQFQRILKKTPNDNSALYYYMGNIKKNLKQEDSALIFYQYADSLFSVNKDWSINTINLYKDLIDIYKDKNWDQKQLLDYYDKLIRVDSILDFERAYTNARFEKDLNLPEIREKRTALKEKLQEKADRQTVLLWVVSPILGIAIIFLFITYAKSVTYEKRYQALLRDGQPPKSAGTKSVSGPKLKPLEDTIRFELLHKLNAFETNEGFKNNKLTLSILAKQLETNSSYLSKTINKEKGKNFSQYLKDLRVDYAIAELKSNEKWRKYTVESLAKEIGFNSAASFYKAFKEKTGITPSYFIKKLDKHSI